MVSRRSGTSLRAVDPPPPVMGAYINPRTGGFDIPQEEYGDDQTLTDETLYTNLHSAPTRRHRTSSLETHEIEERLNQYQKNVEQKFGRRLWGSSKPEARQQPSREPPTSPGSRDSSAASSALLGLQYSDSTSKASQQSSASMLLGLQYLDSNSRQSRVSSSSLFSSPSSQQSSLLGTRLLPDSSDDDSSPIKPTHSRTLTAISSHSAQTWKVKPARASHHATATSREPAIEDDCSVELSLEDAAGPLDRHGTTRLTAEDLARHAQRHLRDKPQDPYERLVHAKARHEWKKQQRKQAEQRQQQLQVVEEKQQLRVVEEEETPPKPTRRRRKGFFRLLCRKEKEEKDDSAWRGQRTPSTAEDRSMFMDEQEKKRIERNKQKYLARERHRESLQQLDVFSHTRSTAEVSTISSHSRNLPLCAVCHERERTHIATPCMHYSFCRDCIADSTSCPICHTPNVEYAAVSVS